MDDPKEPFGSFFSRALIMTAVVAVIVLNLGFCTLIKQNRSWKHFVAEHDCVATGKTREVKGVSEAEFVCAKGDVYWH